MSVPCRSRAVQRHILTKESQGTQRPPTYGDTRFKAHAPQDRLVGKDLGGIDVFFHARGGFRVRYLSLFDLCLVIPELFV